MIDAVGAYFYRHVWRNAGRILQTSHPYLAGVLAVLTIYPSNPLCLSDVTIGNLSAFSFTYNTVIFGFAIAALALAVAIPNDRFLAFLSQRNSEGQSPYRDLVFIFSWTGVVHSVAFFVALVTLMLYGQDHKLAGQSRGGWGYALLGLYVFLQLYAFFQFIVTIISAFELADLYAQFLSRRTNDKGSTEIK